MAKRLDLCLSSYGLRDSEVNRMFKLHKMAIEDTGSSQAVEHVDKEFATTYTALDQAGCTRMRHLLQATVSAFTLFPPLTDLFAEPPRHHRYCMVITHVYTSSQSVCLHGRQ